MREDSGLGGELVEGGKVETRKAALVELLVREFVEQEPDDPLVMRIRCELGFVERGRWVEVAGLPAAPDQLREDQQTGEGEEPQDGGGCVLDPFEAGDESPPEDRDRYEDEQADDGDGVGEPVGDLGTGEVGEGMEKNRRQSKNEGRP